MSELHTAARRVAQPFPGLLDQVRVVPFRVAGPGPGRSEEFRMLCARLNHLQDMKGLRTMVVSSPGAGEGKSFVAAHLALAEAELKDHVTLLCDFDFRHPVLHDVFGIQRTPGLADYLQNSADLNQIVKRIGDSNLYVMPAGSQHPNPVELLTLPHARRLLEELSGTFNWIILDTAPLLEAADANLLSTYADGTLLVVRTATTELKSIPVAIRSLSRDNVVGVVVNGSFR